jgi:hypothetical protein
MPELLVTYDQRRDVLDVRCGPSLPDAVHHVASDTTLYYRSDTRQVVGLTLHRFLTRFPLAACTLAVEEHGAAVAREYLTTYPVISS